MSASRFRFSAGFRRVVATRPLLTSIGMDFGPRNTAFCALEHAPYRVLDVQMVPVNLLLQAFPEKGTQDAINQFCVYIEGLLVQYKPDIFVGELFFSRGARNQNAGLCMFMLALTSAMCRQRGVRFIPVNSGAWKGKGWLQKIMPVQDLYALKVKKYTHMIDGVMLALYADKKSIIALQKPGLKDLIRTASQIPEPRKRKA